MTRASALTRGRLLAEAGMTDTCTITRAGTPTTDPSTGDVTSTPTTVYTGACRVQQHPAEAQREEIGGDHLLLLRAEVQLPVVGSEGLAVGDAVTVTAAAHDADLIGRVFLIHDLAHASEKTARRLQCVERTDS